MSDKTQDKTDDDLLANAIPIGDIEELEDAADEAPKRPSIVKQEEPPEIESIDLAEEEPAKHKEIKALGGREHQQETWKRKTNTTGAGATHMRTFVAKLRLDAIDHLDEQVNEWLDEHPEYEVKMVNATVGILTGKLKEEALFINVWV